MGVNLGGIIPREEISFDFLRGKVVAIDAFNIMYQFLSSIRGGDGTPLKDSKGCITSHLQGLFSRSLNLMSKGIKLVYVFDGEPPEMKLAERDRRKILKLKAEGKYREAVKDKDVDEMSKYAKQFSRLTSEMVEEAKELVSAMGIPVVQAPSEADAQISYMCGKKGVDFAASSDYDCLLFGSPFLIRNLTLSQKRKTSSGKYVITFLELIKLSDVLKTLELNHNQLIALGIFVGTDFNIGGVTGIGPKKALKLVKDCEDFDKLFADFDVDWKPIFNFFKNCPSVDDYKLEWKSVDVIKIKKMLVECHEFSEPRIDSMLEKYNENIKKYQSSLDSFF